MESLRAKVAAHRRLASDRVWVGVSPHALYTIRPALFAAINAYVAEEGLPTSIHIAESPSESALTERGEGPFAEMYARRGITWETPRCHTDAVRRRHGRARAADTRRPLRPPDRGRHRPDGLRRARPSSTAPKAMPNSARASRPSRPGCRLPGLRLGLGTDSAVSNNALDLFEEMRFALLMQRAVREEVEAVTARDVVRMATLGGAEAMGLASHTGSLTPGKRADLIAVRLDRPHAVPATDPYAALVYSARADDVVLTLCDGERFI